MNISVEKLPKSTVKITVSVTEEDMKKFLDRAVKDISRHVKIPGFRPGHVPFDVLKQHVHEKAIWNHAVEIALPEIYSDAVAKENLQVVARPKINLLKTNPLEFEATMAVYPEVKISGYDKLNIEKKEVKVEDKDIDDILKQIQKDHAKYQPADRAAQKGDRVEIDFEGFDEGGALLENTKSKNHPVVIGEGTMVPGFEDELAGMKTGEEKRFKVTFPKDYFHKPFQGKAVEFKVTMQKVEEVILPEWDSEFIKTVVGEEKTLEEIRGIAKERLMYERQHEEKNRRENAFLEKIIELTEVEVPEALVEEEIDGMIDEFKNELSSKGITLEMYLEQTKKELKDLREIRLNEAEKRLKLRFGLQQLFKQEQIEATPEEVQEEIDHLVSLYPKKEQYQLQKLYSENNYLHLRMENKIRMEKLFEKFLK